MHWIYSLNLVNLFIVHSVYHTQPFKMAPCCTLANQFLFKLSRHFLRQNHRAEPQGSPSRPDRPNTHSQLVANAYIVVVAVSSGSYTLSGYRCNLTIIK